jgi:hypothetical protein
MRSPDDGDAALATRAFARIFDAFEPWGSSFAPTMSSRALIFDTDPFGLDVAALAALRAAADDDELARVFISADTPTGSAEDPNLFVLAPLDEQTYKQTFEPWTITPHAIYPPSGRWGIITTSDGYVVAGGSEDFIERLLRSLARDETR